MAAGDQARVLIDELLLDFFEQIDAFLGLVAGQAPSCLQLVQVKINARVHIESERIMRNKQVGFVRWLSAFLKSATYVM